MSGAGATLSMQLSTSIKRIAHSSKARRRGGSYTSMGAAWERPWLDFICRTRAHRPKNLSMVHACTLQSGILRTVTSSFIIATEDGQIGPLQ